MKLIFASFLTALLPCSAHDAIARSTAITEDQKQNLEQKQEEHQPEQRRTALGDFDEFNSVFENASIFIPETYEVSERVALIKLDMTIQNIKCYDISVGDISIDHFRESNQSIDVDVNVMKLDLNCELDYSYKYGLLEGDGWLKLTTDDNSAFTKLNFESEDFNSLPPSGSSVKECVADVEIENMDFEGDFVSEILEIFQRLIRGVVENAIGNVACEELGSLGTTLVSGMLDLAEEKLEPYRGDLGSDVTDALYLERTVDIPDDLVALDLKDTESAVGRLFLQALDGFDAFLGTAISNPDDNTNANGNERDLAINIFLRSYFLDEDNAYTLDASQLPLESAVVFEGHDRITETKMTLNKVRVFGLDTMSRFNPFIDIGSYTLQNELTWDKLTVEFDVTVDIKPSTLDDAILQDPTSEGVSERIQIDFGVDNVDVVASLLVLIDEVALGSLEIGPLLYSEHLFPCLLSALHRAEVSGLEIAPQVVNEPTLTGFISPGLDRVISDSVEAAFEMYTGVLEKAIPNIFQTTVRSFVNDNLVDGYLSDPSKTSCPEVDGVDGFVNFESFFDRESNLYGDLPPMLKELFDSELLVEDSSTGKLRINDVLIAPFTKEQSGIEGTVKFAGDMFGIVSESLPQFGMDSIELRAFDPTIQHLDTMGSPLDIMKPNETNGLVLDNIATFGVGDQPLRLALSGLFDVSGGDPVLEMHNELEVGVDIADSTLFASLLAKLDGQSLSSFPLRDITNPDCWFATLATSMLDEEGRIVDNSESGLSLEKLLLTLSSASFNIKCTNCTSPGLSVLPTLLNDLETVGVSDVLEERLVKLGLELAESEYSRASVNRMLVEGSLRCPHSPNFVSKSATSNYPVPASPALSYESLESVAFAATLLVQMGTVVIAESHNYYDVETTSALSGQDELDVDSDVRLVDFTSMKESLGEWADFGVDQLLEYLGATIEDSNGPNGSDLRINNLLRSSLLDENGLFEIGFGDLSYGSGDMGVSLKHIRIVGLDSISSIEVLDAIGPQTLRNQLKWDNLGIQAVVTLMGPESDTAGRSLKTKKDITFSLTLSDIDVSMALLLAMDLDLLGSLELSSMLDMKNIIPCLLSGARAAKLTELEVSVGSITDFSIEGFESSGLNAAISESSRIMMENYGDRIISSMPGFFDMTVRALVNNWMSFYMGDWSSVACPKSMFESTGSGFVDLRDLLLSATKSRMLGGSGSLPYGNLFSTVIGFVKDLVLKIDVDSGLSAVNKVLVEPLTRSQSSVTGSYEYVGDLFSSGTRIEVGGLDATVEVRAYDARIDNLDTIGAPLSVLEPMMDEGHHLNNTVTFGVADKPLRLATKLYVSLIGDDDIQIRNEVDVSLDLSNANVMLETMVKIAEPRLYGFPLRDTLDLNCWLATIPAPTLDSRGVRLEGEESTMELMDLAATIAAMNLKIDCIDCSSPKMTEFTELLSSSGAQEDATEFVNSVFDYFADLMGGNFLQVQIDRLLNDAARKCPHSPQYVADAENLEYDAFKAPDTDYTVSYLILLACVTIAVLLLVAFAVFAVRTIVHRRHKKWLNTLPPHQVRRLSQLQAKEHDFESELNRTTKSMFNSTEIPAFVRYGMPLIILLNIGFFLSGHLSLGATVNIEAEVAGEKFRVEKFFEFSMAKSTVDIWNAGGRELAIMILIFSGIWPYTKQLMTLALWFLPPSTVSASKRGSILLWLDWLAKWSMIDIFVLVISIAAFRVSVTSPELNFLPKDFYSIDMLVVPLWGLYANMIAQLISQVSSHFIIHYHRRIVKRATQAARLGDSPRSIQYGAGTADSKGIVPQVSFDYSLGSANENNNSNDNGASNVKTALHEHQFGRPHRGETEKLIVRAGVNSMLWLVALLLVGFVLIGCIVPTFSLEILGIIGVAVESGQGFEDATTSHSVFTVLQLLIEEARFLDTLGDYIGLGTLSLLMVFSVLIVPVIQSLALLRQWFSPSTQKQRARMSIFIEILQAWQYAEVYLLAVFVASWQLGPVSEFMINAYCDSLKDTFAQLAYYGVLKEEDAQCFSVQSSIEGGSFLLATGAVLLALLNTFVAKAVLQYFRDQEEAEKRPVVSIMDEKSLSSDDTDNTEQDIDIDGDGFSGKILPVPVLFTDTFRWVLRQEHGLRSSSRALFGDPEGQYDVPEATAVPYDVSLDGTSTVEGKYVSEKDDMMMSSRSSKKGGTPGGDDASVSSRRSGSGSSLGYRAKAAGVARRLSYQDGSDDGSSNDSSSRGFSDGRPRAFKTDKSPSVRSMGNQSASRSNNVAPDEQSVLSASSGGKRRSAVTSRSQKTSTESAVPSEYFQEEMTLNESPTVYEDIDTETQSEYVEETIDDGFEEYTVDTMSETGGHMI